MNIIIISPTSVKHDRLTDEATGSESTGKNQPVRSVPGLVVVPAQARSGSAGSASREESPGLRSVGGSGGLVNTNI